MPARPSAVEILCAAAAVIEYIKCPLTDKVVTRPKGSKAPTWLWVNTN